MMGMSFLASEMGELQTYFYLALVSAIALSLTFILVGIAIYGLVRWFRSGGAPLTVWLVGGAIIVTLLFMVLGTVGVLYGFVRYGAS